nr:hypothetical protein CFP56_18482 [Quercus suber]
MYGPWIVVKRKVNGAKSQRSNEGPQLRRNIGNVQWPRDGFTKGDSAGLSRETKRKISPFKVRFEAQGACSVVEKEGLKELKGLSFSSLSPKVIENGKKGTKTEKAKLATKPSPQASVKGKKAVARSRAKTNTVDSSAGSPVLQAAIKNLPFLSIAECNGAAPNGRSYQGVSSKAQYTIYVEAKNGGEGVADGVRRDPCASNLGLEPVQLTAEESMEDGSPMDRSGCEDGWGRNNGHRVEEKQQSVEGMSIGDDGYEQNSEEYLEASRMVLDGGGKSPISC